MHRILTEVGVSNGGGFLRIAFAIGADEVRHLVGAGGHGSHGDGGGGLNPTATATAAHATSVAPAAQVPAAGAGHVFPFRCQHVRR